jgi:hypothetical protein
MEFMDHLYQFGQFGILTFRDGIQEVSGSILLISTIPYKTVETATFRLFLFYFHTFYKILKCAKKGGLERLNA